MEGIIKRISKIKGIGYIALAAAAAIILLCLPSFKSENGKSAASSVSVDDDLKAYIEDLEKRTEEILSKISGVSDCVVMITADCSFSYSYAADQSVKQSYDDNGALVSDSNEKKYVTVNSNGAVSTVKTKTTMPKISGIAVICPKASDSALLAVMNTLKALFDINSNRISVQS